MLTSCKYALVFEASWRRSARDLFTCVLGQVPAERSVFRTNMYEHRNAVGTTACLRPGDILRALGEGLNHAWSVLQLGADDYSSAGVFSGSSSKDRASGGKCASPSYRQIVGRLINSLGLFYGSFRSQDRVFAPFGGPLHLPLNGLHFTWLLLFYFFSISPLFTAPGSEAVLQLCVVHGCQDFCLTRIICNILAEIAWRTVVQWEFAWLCYVLLYSHTNVLHIAYLCIGAYGRQFGRSCTYGRHSYFSLSFHMVFICVALDIVSRLSDTCRVPPLKISSIHGQTYPGEFSMQAIWVFGLVWCVRPRCRRPYLCL